MRGDVRERGESHGVGEVRPVPLFVLRVSMCPSCCLALEFQFTFSGERKVDFIVLFFF